MKKYFMCRFAKLTTSYNFSVPFAVYFKEDNA